MDGDGTVILRNYAGSAPNINVGRNAFDKRKKYARMLQIRTRQTFMINKQILLLERVKKQQIMLLRIILLSAGSMLL